MARTRMTEEQKQARMDELKAAREKKYFEEQAEAKTEAAAKLTTVPAPDAYIYSAAWRQGVGTAGGQFNLVKTPNPYYDPATNTITDPVTGETRPAGVSMTSTNLAFPQGLPSAPGKTVTSVTRNADGSYTIRYSDGTSSKQSATANPNPSGKTESGRTTNADGSVTITYSDGTTSVIPAPGNGNNTGYKVVNGVLTFNGQAFSGTYNGTRYVNGVAQALDASGDGSTANQGYNVIGGKLYFNGNLFTGTFSGQTYENGAVKATSASNVMTAGQQDVYSIMLGRLNQYNLGALAPLIRKLAIEGATESTIMLQLSEEPLYKERFKANEARKQKGLSVLTPSQYLSLEDDYRQVLRAYGLTQFDNDAYVSQFLANDVSVSELSNRVVTAVQRVRNADPAVSNMLKNLYGIGQNDLVAYVLDPAQQFQKIERQVAASEISVAAARQGFNIGATVAEQLAAQGISQAEAQKGYATIADILPTAEKLSDIYGGQLESYRLAEGEQEVFNQLASAQRKRRALTERELASFSGQAGLGRTSLTQQTGGQF